MFTSCFMMLNPPRVLTMKKRMTLFDKNNLLPCVLCCQIQLRTMNIPRSALLGKSSVGGLFAHLLYGNNHK